MLGALARVVALLPFGALRVLGAVIAFLAFDVLRIRRRHAVASIERAGLGDVATARRAYRSLGTAIFELLWLAGRPRVRLEEHVRIEGMEHFERARARGRGIVVATAHTGNWDLAACACAEKAPLAVVTKRLSSRGLDAFWQRTRSKRGIELVAAPDGGVLRAVKEALSAGKMVALLVDQDPERTTSVVAHPFLGEVAMHDTFAATLAARTGATILVAFARREGRGHVVEILEGIEPPARAGRAFVEATTRAIAERLDAFVRRDPTSWLWLHRRWKSRPTATTNQSDVTACTDRACTSSRPDSPTADCTRSAQAAPSRSA